MIKEVCERDDPYSDIILIFDKKYEGPDTFKNVPTNTSFQRAMKKYFEEGGVMGAGIGVILFDGEKIINKNLTKTTIPLKNIFDSSPVSRSQTRRICNRLDKFEQVILDFSNIEWMGQGFAHQIFVVFQNENPNIELKPINMNESVTKMYKHVIN